MNDELPQLKQVSKVKHAILAKYLVPWSTILGSAHRILFYVDCFAGPGIYRNGEIGSPIIALRTAKAFLERSQDRAMYLIFVDEDQETLNCLRRQIELEKPLPQNLDIQVVPEDAEDFVSKLLSSIDRNIPAFFFIDPYGHPLSVPTINAILQRKYAEVFVNLMWFRINIDLANPKKHCLLNSMFGHDNWKNKPFMRESGDDRESHFLDYFLKQFDCPFRRDFRIRFSPEDKVRGRETRTKYYLIHLSKHPKAVLLMKEIMFRLGDEAGTFDYSASQQRDLFSSSPTIGELKQYLKDHYCGSGKAISFDRLREETYSLPFIETHYRSVLKELEKEKCLVINRVQSIRTGISGRDMIQF